LGFRVGSRINNLSARQHDSNRESIAEDQSTDMIPTKESKARGEEHQQAKDGVSSSVVSNISDVDACRAFTPVVVDITDSEVVEVDVDTTSASATYTSSSGDGEDNHTTCRLFRVRAEAETPLPVTVLLKLSHDLCNYSTSLSQQVTALRRENRRLNREMNKMNRSAICSHQRLQKFDDEEGRVVDATSPAEQTHTEKATDNHNVKDVTVVYKNQYPDPNERVMELKHRLNFFRERRTHLKNNTMFSTQQQDSHNDVEFPTCTQSTVAPADDDTVTVLTSSKSTSTVAASLSRLISEVDRLSKAVYMTNANSASHQKKYEQRYRQVLEKENEQLSIAPLTSTAPAAGQQDPSPEAEALLVSKDNALTAHAHAGKCDPKDEELLLLGKKGNKDTLECEWKQRAEELEQKLHEKEMQMQQLMRQLSSLAASSSSAAAVVSMSKANVGAITKCIIEGPTTSVGLGFHQSSVISMKRGGVHVASTGTKEGSEMVNAKRASAA
jgi:hypothetical protein